MLELEWLVVKALWTLNVLASALVIWRLYSTDLYGKYRLFFASSVCVFARSAALFPFGPRTAPYYRIWISTEPVLWLSYVLVVFELYRLFLGHYRGIYSVGRWFFFGSVATSAIISALTVLPTISVARIKQPLVYYYGLAERGIGTSLGIFLLLLLILIAWFPVPLSRNLLTHCVVYAVFFFINNIVTLYRQVSLTHTDFVVNLCKLSIALACLFCWAFFLSRRGEDRIASLHLGRSPLQEKHLLGQLEGLNDTLLRTARK
jgi:hypothetical protein